MGGGHVAFGPFVLDRAAGCLLRSQTPVPLRPKAWAFLCHLARRPGKLVTERELRAAVWPGVTVTPQTLTNVVRELRRALSDDARAPRYIGTVHGRGYVFLGAQPDDPLAAPLVVGRDAAIDRLDAVWRAVQEGRSQVAFV